MNLPNNGNAHGGVSLRLVLGILVLALLPVLLWAESPAWWTARGIQNTNPANDYAAANQGQVKNIATAAVAELDASLPGGAGDVLLALASNLSGTTPNTNDYAAVNLGQLKTVAKPFYDRLSDFGYDGAPLSPGQKYPWEGSTRQPNDYAMANIGQVKNLFSFDVTSIDYYNGTLPTLKIISGGNQRVAAGSGFLPIPLCVQVSSETNVLTNAPITFSVTSGGALLSPSYDLAALSGTLQVRSNSQTTDSQGNLRTVAQIYIYASGTDSDLSVIHATATSGTTSISGITTAATTDSTLTPTTNFDAYITSGSTVELNWVSSDTTKPTTLLVTTDGGATWMTLGVARAGITMANVTGVSFTNDLLFSAYTGGTPGESDSGGGTVPEGVCPSFSMSSQGGSGGSGGSSSSSGGSAQSTSEAPKELDIPVRTYAAIDLGEIATSIPANSYVFIREDGKVAINDNNQVAILKPDGVYSGTNGQLTKTLGFPSQTTAMTDWSCYSPHAIGPLKADGSVLYLQEEMLGWASLTYWSEEIQENISYSGYFPWNPAFLFAGTWTSGNVFAQITLPPPYNTNVTGYNGSNLPGWNSFAWDDVHVPRWIVECRGDAISMNLTSGDVSEFTFANGDVVVSATNGGHAIQTINDRGDAIGEIYQNRQPSKVLYYPGGHVKIGEYTETLYDINHSRMVVGKNANGTYIWSPNSDLTDGNKTYLSTLVPQKSGLSKFSKPVINNKNPNDQTVTVSFEADRSHPADKDHPDGYTEHGEFMLSGTGSPDATGSLANSGIWNLTQVSSDIFNTYGFIDPNARGCTVKVNNSSSDTNKEHGYFLLPIDITVRKKGDTSTNPTVSGTGVLVKVNDTIEVALAPQYFDQDKQLENVISWEYRLLQANGILGPDWHKFSDLGTGDGGKGTKMEAQCITPCIMQIRAVISTGGTDQTFNYVRKKDDPYGANSAGTFNEIYRKGQPDYVGVGNDAEFNIVRAAQASLGSTAWAESATITLSTGFVAKSGTPKCNIFDYQSANPSKSIPTDSGGSPPRAYDWWNSGFSVAGWTFHNETALAEPGTVIARYKGQWLGFRIPGTHAHCGITDYDGAWINAGPSNVNRYPHITNSDYQTAHFRN